MRVGVVGGWAVKYNSSFCWLAAVTGRLQYINDEKIRQMRVTTKKPAKLSHNSGKPGTSTRQEHGKMKNTNKTDMMKEYNKTVQDNKMVDGGSGDSLMEMEALFLYVIGISLVFLVVILIKARHFIRRTTPCIEGEDPVQKEIIRKFENMTLN